MTSGPVSIPGPSPAPLSRAATAFRTGPYVHRSEVAYQSSKSGEVRIVSVLISNSGSDGGTVTTNPLWSLPLYLTLFADGWSEAQTTKGSPSAPLPCHPDLTFLCLSRASTSTDMGALPQGPRGLPVTGLLLMAPRALPRKQAQPQQAPTTGSPRVARHPECYQILGVQGRPETLASEQSSRPPRNTQVPLESHTQNCPSRST